MLAAFTKDFFKDLFFWFLKGVLLVVGGSYTIAYVMVENDVLVKFQEDVFGAGFLFGALAVFISYHIYYFFELVDRHDKKGMKYAQSCKERF